MKTQEFQAHRLDIEAFARARGELQGQDNLADLKRLGADLLIAEDEHRRVDWQVQGGHRRLAAGQVLPMLQLRARATVPMQCQRCLGVVDIGLDVDRVFLFAADEDEAARLDEDQDDDLLVVSRAFNLITLLEDELILALPIVPRHDACAPPAPSQETQTSPAPERPHPFDALRVLRGKN
jgi:uncharacterized protein